MKLFFFFFKFLQLRIFIDFLKRQAMWLFKCKIGSKRGCASLDLGTSFGVDGNIQLFGAAEAMVDLTGNGVNLGVMSQYLMNTENGNTRGNQTLGGGQFYGPGYFVGVGLRITR